MPQILVVRLRSVAVVSESSSFEILVQCRSKGNEFTECGLPAGPIEADELQAYSTVENPELAARIARRAALREFIEEISMGTGTGATRHNETLFQVDDSPPPLAETAFNDVLLPQGLTRYFEHDPQWSRRAEENTFVYLLSPLEDSVYLQDWSPRVPSYLQESCGGDADDEAPSSGAGLHRGYVWTPLEDLLQGASSLPVQRSSAGILSPIKNSEREIASLVRRAVNELYQFHYGSSPQYLGM